MRLTWLTDIHLDFVDSAGIDRLVDEVLEGKPDAILLGGDTSVAPRLEEHLTRLAGALRRPIYFVLGNHDSYHGSIAGARALADRLSRESPWLRWLPASGVVELDPKTALVGHDGWADGRLGSGARSQVLLNDYLRIEELAGLATGERFARLAMLGDEAAAHFRAVLPGALARFERLIVLTHVPPFREACWHEGAVSSDEFLPHFACRVVGEVLREAMVEHPRASMLVLCGHTHGAGVVEVLPNLTVRTGGATYGRPRVQATLEG